MSLTPRLFARMRAFLVAEDEAGNALLGPKPGNAIAGNPHYTLSQRWGLGCRGGSAGACRMCKVLTVLQNMIPGARKTSNHCEDALAGTPLDIPTGG